MRGVIEMYYNLKIEGLILLGFIFAFYKSQKSVRLEGTKMFWYMYGTAVLTHVLDIVSTITIINGDVLSEDLVSFVTKAYLFSLVVVTFMGLGYVCVDMLNKLESMRRVFYFFLGFTGLAAVGIMVLPLHIHFDDAAGELYTFGPSAYLTYGVVGVFLLANMVIMFIKKREINPKRRRVVWIWMATWVTAVLVQFLFPNILVVSLASAIGVLVVFVMFENPESKIDSKTGFFNQTIFLEYVKERFDKDQTFAVLDIIVNSDFLLTSSESIFDMDDESAWVEMTTFLMGLRDVHVFAVDEAEYLLVLENPYNVEQIINRVRDRFEGGWGKHSLCVHPNWIYVENPLEMADGKELLYMIQYARVNWAEYSESDYLVLDQHLFDDVKHDMETQRLIKAAIENDRIEVYYQPIYSIEENKFTSAEALVRVFDERGKMIPPSDFIHVAEMNGMIIQLGAIIFEKACKAFKEQHFEELGIHYIEINLSVVQCSYKQLYASFSEIMKRHELPAEYINLEITESANVNDKRNLMNNMVFFRRDGVSFSLDDFGTGMSNLNYIMEMPVDIVKFDRELTQAYFTNVKARLVMEATIHMIKDLGLKIVSEGVETEEQFKKLKELGVDYIQGYYFSKPIPERKFIDFIKQHNFES